MNKRKFIACTIASVLIFSLAFNGRTIARFSKKFDTVSQTINAASFNVETNNTLKNKDAHKPGELISEDTITLKNDNDYDVEFIIKLTAENINETEFINYLNLTILDGENPLEGSNNEYKIQIPKNTEKIVVAKVDWKTDENGEVDASAIEGGAVKYIYDIVAKQIILDSDSKAEEDASVKKYIKTFITDADVESWVGITNSNPSQVRELNDNSMIIKKDAYTELKEYSKLNEGETLTIKTKAEFIGSNDAEEGFVYSLMMSEDFNNKKNNYTSTIYKKMGNIYIDAEKINYPKTPSNIVAKGNKTTETQFILSSQFTKKDNNVKCYTIIADKDGKSIKEWALDKHLDDDNYKLYASFNNLIGTSGIRVKEIEITKELKSVTS
jgi:hypothetical protein